MYLSSTARQWAWLRTLALPEVRRLSPILLWRMRRMLSREKLVRTGGYTTVNSFLPPLNHPAFRRLMNNLPTIISGKAVPVSAYIAVTGECGYNCEHCSNKRRPGQDMSTDTLLHTVEQLDALGVSIIGFTGGEPLRRPELDSCIRAASKTATLLFTNGEGLTLERARQLKTAGLWGVAVSLDHYDEAEHDRGRGYDGAYQRAVEAIDAARRAELYTMTQMIARPDHCNEAFFDRYLQLTHRLGVHEIRLLEPMPTGHLAVAEPDRFLNDAERRQLFDLHVRTNRNRSMTKVNAFAYIEDESMFGCGAGFQHLYIDYRGDLCPCDFTPISFGNIHEESLESMWARMNSYFRRPGRRCFLMENMDLLKQQNPEVLPIPCKDIIDRCRFNTHGALPLYYRQLNFPEIPASHVSTK